MEDKKNFELYSNIYKFWLDKYIESKDFQKGLNSLWFEGPDFIMFYYHVGSRFHKKDKIGNDLLNYKTFSNFHPILNFYTNALGKEFESVITYSTEHAFQAAKYSENNKTYALRILQNIGPHDAIKLGRNKKIIGIDKNWDNNKFYVMLNIVRDKAKICEEFKKELLSTGDKIIIENTNNASTKDAIWGCGKDGKGLNYLGLVLMIIRNEILK